MPYVALGRIWSVLPLVISGLALSRYWKAIGLVAQGNIAEARPLVEDVVRSHREAEQHDSLWRAQLLMARIDEQAGHRTSARNAAKEGLQLLGALQQREK